MLHRILKTLAMYLLGVGIIVGASSCGEEFAAGFGTGATVMATMADDAQERFIESVNELNAETAKINEGVSGIKGSVMVKPETLAALKGLKGREKDPVTWIALASMLANAGVFGNALRKKKE